jgi:hypothetical protein
MKGHHPQIRHEIVDDQAQSAATREERLRKNSRWHGAAPPQAVPFSRGRRRRSSPACAGVSIPSGRAAKRAPRTGDRRIGVRRRTLMSRRTRRRRPALRIAAGRWLSAASSRSATETSRYRSGRARVSRRRGPVPAVSPTRPEPSSMAPFDALGADWADVLQNDGWPTYRQFTLAAHQICLAPSVARRCWTIHTVRSPRRCRRRWTPRSAHAISKVTASYPATASPSRAGSTSTASRTSSHGAEQPPRPT